MTTTGLPETSASEMTSVCVSFSQDEIVALAELLAAPTLAALLVTEEDDDLALTDAQRATALRGLVARRALHVADSDEVTLVGLHADVLGVAMAPDLLVRVATWEGDQLDQAALFRQGDDTVCFAARWAGVYDFTLAGPFALERELRSRAPVFSRDGEAGDPFDVPVTLLTQLGSGTVPADLGSDDMRSFADDVINAVRTCRCYALRRLDGDALDERSLSWVDGGAQLWLLDEPEDPEGSVTVRRVTSDEVESLLAALIS